ncbi:MAG: hypothetical protein ABIK53_02885 [bacterium]
MKKEHIKEKIVVPKYPYRSFVKEVDFLDKKRYAKELQELSKKRYDVVNFTTAVDLDEKGEIRLNDKIRVVYIVDIDNPFLNTALEMAEMNNEYGIPCTFNPRLYHFEDDKMDSIIKKISHIPNQEIGYQYEEVADAKGNIKKAREAFGNNLEYVNTKYKIKTLMAHGRTGEGYHTGALFRDRSKYNPGLWEKFGLRHKADFYYFIKTINGGIYYFNESTRFQAEEYVETLKCFKPNNIAVMLHHSSYLHKGIKDRPNRKIFKGMDGVAHIFPEKD